MGLGGPRVWPISDTVTWPGGNRRRGGGFRAHRPSAGLCCFDAPMKPLIALSALCLVAPVAAVAAESSPLARAFGNTVVSTYPDGRTGLLWLKTDGSYDAKGRHRTSSSGKWTLRGGRVCLKQAKPRAAPFSYCTALPSGESWRARAVTGEPIIVRIVRGVAS